MEDTKRTKKVTINLDEVPIQALYYLAESCKDEKVLNLIFEVGVEKDDEWIFTNLAKNHSPAIKSVLEKVNGAIKTPRAKKIIYNDEFAKNPYSPPELLEECLKKNALSSALYNPNTPAEALNKCFPILFVFKDYICEQVVETNGEKLSDEVLESIIEKYPSFELPKKILEKRKNK